HFAVRTVVTVHAGGSIDDYYGTDRGPDPYLPGEVADYLGVGYDQRLELTVDDAAATLVLQRGADGQTRLHGLGAHIAREGYTGGEVSLRFARPARVAIHPVGFWNKTEDAIPAATAHAEPAPAHPARGPIAEIFAH